MKTHNKHIVELRLRKKNVFKIDYVHFQFSFKNEKTDSIYVIIVVIKLTLRN